MPGLVVDAMDEFAALTGRVYRLFDYEGAPEAERVVIVMGSGAETVRRDRRMARAKGEKVGVLKVRLYRPLSPRALRRRAADDRQAIAVLDRTKEPGALGEPLCLDVVAALAEARRTGLSNHFRAPRRRGPLRPLLEGVHARDGRAVFAELAKSAPKRQFTVGIVDDVTHTSLPVGRLSTSSPRTRPGPCSSASARTAPSARTRTRSRSSARTTDKEAQGYFVYDSKKSGAITISHLRFGDAPIRAAYLVSNADFVACHQFAFLDRFDVLDAAKPGGVFLLNAPYGPDEVWDQLPREVQDADRREESCGSSSSTRTRVAREIGLGGRINTIMQACFFEISGVLPRDDAIARIKKAHRQELRPQRRGSPAEELRGGGRGARRPESK